MAHILITGATGNVGTEVIRCLLASAQDLSVTAAVRYPEKSAGLFPSSVSLRHFDFERPDSFASAFHQVDILFLLRPPHISNVKKHILPLLKAAKDNGIQKVIFLSVQGAEKSSVIPHRQIEKLIMSMKFHYIFVRPGYFMQNLTTTLLDEIQKEGSITLPAASAKFNWIDVQNIGEAVARLAVDFDYYQDQEFVITGPENINFNSVCSMITRITGKPVIYRPVNPLRFYFFKRRRGVPHPFALVMTLLHFLPRLQPEPLVSEDYHRLTGNEPASLQDFIRRHKDILTPE
jgi:uncharacterized protein YbjT (DUF2867 family)